jgi:hypothetical protein
MNEQISTTRISDLPDSNSGKLPQYSNASPASQNFNENTYTPLNIHPNPYGNMPPQVSIMSPPMQTKSPQEQSGYLGGSAGIAEGSPQYPLPSRDIPRDTLPLVQDEHIRANYIPTAPRSNLGFIEEDEWAPKRKDKKKKVHFEEDWFELWKRPILLAMLFFLFQMPMITVIMLKYLTFMKLFNESGDLNYPGFVIKSVIFGLGVYGVEILMQNSTD